MLRWVHIHHAGVTEHCDGSLKGSRMCHSYVVCLQRLPEPLIIRPAGRAEYFEVCS